MLNIPQGDFSLYILILIFLWNIPWKGVALWKASRLSHKNWFVVILLLNTMGILEIFYIFRIAKNYSVQTEEVKNNSEK